MFVPLVVAHLDLFELEHTSNGKLTVHRDGSTISNDVTEQQREEEKRTFSL